MIEIKTIKTVRQTLFNMGNPQRQIRKYNGTKMNGAKAIAGQLSGFMWSWSSELVCCVPDPRASFRNFFHLLITFTALKQEEVGNLIFHFMVMEHTRPMLMA